MAQHRGFAPSRSLRALVLALATLSPRPALAQACESARPTDAGGAAGLSYGSAEVAFFDSGSGRVRVHYALSGSHAPPAASTRRDGVPDAIAVAAEAGDDALAKFEELGYRAPLSDAASPCASNGGSDALDVYLLNFRAADGQAVSDHCEGEGESPRRCAGFVLVDNDFRSGGYASTAEGLRTVVPHELFHLVQHAYDADVESWWAEGSAQWAAKQVYPELTDLERFLPEYFKSPWRPLNVPPSGPISGFLYATAIWPVFLHEQLGADVVREVFEALAPELGGVFPATDAVLQARGSSLADAFLEFSSFNAATGERAAKGLGYAASAAYPTVPTTELVATPGASADDVASGLGAFFYRVSAPSPIELELDADPERVAARLVPLAEGKARLDEARDLPISFEGEAVVVVAGRTLTRSDAPFVLRARSGSGSSESAGGCALTGGSAAAPSKASLLLAIAAMLGRRARRSRKDG